jgi:hypothetical protein
MRSSDPVVHLGVELSCNEKGEGEGRGSIEKAAGQVRVGAGGLVERARENIGLLGPRADRVLLPVIFTTAKLWTCDADLASADLASGNINLTDANFQSRNFVFLQHPVSPAFRHGALRTPRTTLSADMEGEHLRTVPIVAASGIESFLRLMDPETFSPEEPPMDSPLELPSRY